METTKTPAEIAGELDGHAYPDPRCTAVTALLALVQSGKPQHGAGPHHELLERCGLVGMRTVSQSCGSHPIVTVTPFGYEVSRAILRARGARAADRGLSPREVTRAISKYAKKYGYYVRTVRAVSELRQAAIREYAATEVSP